MNRYSSIYPIPCTPPAPIYKHLNTNRNIVQNMAEDIYSDFTSRDISSLVRVEKSSGQLSVVRKDLYTAMRAAHEKVSKECEAKDVDSMDYELKVAEKKKLVSNIKLVVELRMNKVASMALRGAMGVEVNSAVDQLPPEERQFYNEVFESAKKLWSVPSKKKVVYVPDIVPETETPVPKAPAEEPVVTETPAEQPVEAPPVEVPSVEVHVVPPVPEEEQPAEESDENPDADCFDLVTVRMLETVEPFAGIERNYSLKKEDIVNLPKSIAAILEGRKLAVILKS